MPLRSPQAESAWGGGGRGRGGVPGTGVYLIKVNRKITQSSAHPIFSFTIWCGIFSCCWYWVFLFYFIYLFASPASTLLKALSLNSHSTMCPSSVFSKPQSILCHPQVPDKLYLQHSPPSSRFRFPLFYAPETSCNPPERPGRGPALFWAVMKSPAPCSLPPRTWIAPFICSVPATHLLVT